MYAHNELSDTGFVIANARSSHVQGELFHTARWYVQDNHPLVVAIVGGVSLSCSTFLLWFYQDGIFDSPAVPLFAVISVISFALFWLCFCTLINPVQGVGATLVRDFVFDPKALRPISRRQEACLPVRGIDLWLALVVHMRISGYR